MLKRLIRAVLEPAARLLRAFFDPRIARLDQDLRREIGGKVDAVSRAITEESEIAGIRDEALRDGLTLTNTRIGRIEADLAVIRRRLDELVDEDRNRDLS